MSEYFGDFPNLANIAKFRTLQKFPTFRGMEYVSAGTYVDKNNTHF